ncbi:hypothetical protein SUGI_1021690 [Cryptomeria japonica]|uniref:citrate-binding protein-like n=1 Tax=Cryptomeria japonica TaxID=3369 RepID=UPI002414BB90|nr:citrate-binding protein-like [Cryptomeria japonica]GLJ48399.1 hypothetical protein SUGI_1021690 [Cryptomeria japonica]
MAKMFALLCGLLICIRSGYAQQTGSPTDGFTQQNLTKANFEIQKPYDKEVSQRYSFIKGVHSMWVYINDKPHFRGSKTRPRTEIGIKGYGYTSGVWQFEGEVYVPQGTTGVCVMQIFGGTQHATAFMLHVYVGMLKRYDEQVVATDIYDRWIHVNVIHNADEGKVYVFVEEEEKLVVDDRGPAIHSFKFGVYTQTKSSSCMEARWRNVKVWRK